MIIKVLVVDKDARICKVVEDYLSGPEYRIDTAEDGQMALDMCARNSYDVIIADVWLPRIGGMDLLKKIQNIDSACRVIMIGGRPDKSLIVRTIKAGAYDFLEKPLSSRQIMEVVENAVKKTGNVGKTAKTLSLNASQEIIGDSRELKKLKKLISQSAAGDTKVLISGENGTGKELVALAIHNQSNRFNKPFIAVNCAAIPDALLESELFGHEKGAFTDAINSRRGKFSLANGGTLFLDEIADMSLISQAKVLRAIQDMTITPIGSEETFVIDVRIISATNKNIAAEVEAGRFRQDLYFRLNVVPIEVPPLRKHIADLKELSSYFLQQTIREKKRFFSDAALSLMEKYPWPGNIRELKNFVERVAVISDEKKISPETISQQLATDFTVNEKKIWLDDFVGATLVEAKKMFEKQLVEHILKRNSYNIHKAASELGIYNSNLYNKINKYAIDLSKKMNQSEGSAAFQRNQKYLQEN